MDNLDTLDAIERGDLLPPDDDDAPPPLAYHDDAAPVARPRSRRDPWSEYD